MHGRGSDTETTTQKKCTPVCRDDVSHRSMLRKPLAASGESKAGSDTLRCGHHATSKKETPGKSTGM